MDTLAFISRYEAILKHKQIPKMQFYKDCEITDAAVSQWRKKKTKPAMTTISRIADYLGVSVGYLLGADEELNNSILYLTAKESGMGEAVQLLSYAIADNKKSPAPKGAELSEARMKLLAAIDGMSEDEVLAMVQMAEAAKRMRGDGK